MPQGKKKINYLDFCMVRLKCHKFVKHRTSIMNNFGRIKEKPLKKDAVEEKKIMLNDIQGIRVFWFFFPLNLIKCNSPAFV